MSWVQDSQLDGMLLHGSNKGFAALIDYVKKGIIKKGENVIFILTGGSPAVFAYNEELSKKI